MVVQSNVTINGAPHMEIAESDWLSCRRPGAALHRRLVDGDAARITVPAASAEGQHLCGDHGVEWQKSDGYEVAKRIKMYYDYTTWCVCVYMRMQVG